MSLGSIGSVPLPLAALFAFIGINVGYLLQINCTEQTKSADLCRKNAGVLMWFGSVALFVIVVVGAYGFARSRAL